MSTIDLRNKLRELGYNARVVNWDCLDIDQGGRMHYLSTEEATALVAAGSDIDLAKYGERRGLNHWYTFPVSGESK